mmetsp:Transcript_31750/g.78706  ORF Transcript_31750/g.78706 Transcript_31750/m.78706 type:complete len:111 (+) Transcript_31750:75-407(+)
MGAEGSKSTQARPHHPKGKQEEPPSQSRPANHSGRDTAVAKGDGGHPAPAQKAAYDKATKAAKAPFMTPTNIGSDELFSVLLSHWDILEDRCASPSLQMLMGHNQGERQG